MRMNKYTEHNERQMWGSKRAMLLSGAAVLLALAPVMSASALAETCTASPDCKSLGYTESSCSDGGVKCPFGNYWFCATKCEEKDPCQNCKVGTILNSDMTCSQNKTSGKTPIGVVANQTITSVGEIKCVGMAVALTDLDSKMTWSNANSNSSSYSASGLSGWHLPTEEELLTIYANINSVQGGLTKAGGAQFNSGYYWSSSRYDSINYWAVHPVNGGTSGSSTGTSRYVRPVLAF